MQTNSQTIQEAQQLPLVDETTQYALDVTGGRIVAGPWVRRACQRHLDDLEHGAARGLQWHPPRAAHVYTFFACLQFYDGDRAGEPFELDPSQKFIVGSIFGWFTEDGHRRFRTAYVEEAKGNGKTPLAAGLGLYVTVVESVRNPGAEVYTAAVNQDQAKICHRDAEQFTDSSPALRKRVIKTVNNLAYPRGKAFFRPVSSEGRGLDGKRVALAIIDEVHEHSTAVVVDKMRFGTKGRRDALIFEITNSGYDRNSVCWQHHEYSTKVLDGTFQNDSWFAFIASLDEDDDWMHDESCWIKANPLLGSAVTLKYLREQVKEALEIPSKQNITARLNFCVWTEQATRWLPMAGYEESGGWDDGAEPFDVDELVGRDCFAGLDLSTTTDITALVVAFPPVKPAEKWKLLCWFFVPKANIAVRVKRDHVPYDEWDDAGLLTATEGNVVDYSFVIQTVKDVAQRYNLKKVAIDRWNSTHVATLLGDEGIEAILFGQGFASMAGPSKEFEKLVVGKMLQHGGHLVLRWMAGNAAVKEDPAGNIKPDKSKSTERIDGIVASVMAIGTAMAEPNEPAAPTEVLTV